eukprot:m.23299 g.23299  ORF g.23299 m.23299 type:complete len:579 (+) comp11363_c0_seq2:1050-2786(+)
MSTEYQTHRLHLLRDQCLRLNRQDIVQKIDQALETATENQRTENIYASTPQAEPFDFIAASQATWENKLRSRYQLVAKEHACPTRQRRVPTASHSHRRDKFIEELSPAPLNSRMYVFDTTDLYRELCQVSNPNYCPEGRATKATIETAVPSEDSSSNESLEALFATRVVKLSKLAKAVNRVDEDDYDAAKQHGTLRGLLEKQAESLRQTEESTPTSEAYTMLEMSPTWLLVGQAIRMQPQGAIKVTFQTPTLHDLRLQFRSLGLDSVQIGVDDHFSNPNQSAFVQDYSRKTRNHLAAGSHARLYELCQQGCLAGDRTEVWFRLLCEQDRDHYHLKYMALWRDVLDYSTLTEKLTSADARYVCNLSDVYFVFQDVVQEVLTVFSRDVSVATHLGLAPLPSYSVSGDTKLPSDPCSNGVVPMRGHVLLVAPLAYMSSSTSKVYALFKALYLRFWWRLSTISSHPQGILRLMQCFEVWMQTYHSPLWLHLRSIQAQPSSIAIRWMSTGFASFLAADQLLLLWDRIIGYNSLLFLPLLSVALFAYRRAALLQATKPETVEAILSDVSTVAIVPLLQTSLFTS